MAGHPDNYKTMMRNIRVKYQLLIPLLIFAAVMISLSMHFVSVLLETDLKLTFSKQLTTLVDERSSQVETYLDQLSAQIIGIASDEKMTSCLSSSSTCNKNDVSLYLLRNKMPIISNITELSVIDPNGVLVASTLLNTESGKNFTSTDEFIFGSKQLYISDVYLSPLTNEPTLTVATPIFNNTRIIGVAVGRFHASKLFDIVDNPSNLDRTGEIYIVNKSRLRLTPSRFENNVLLTTVASEPLTDCLNDYKKYGKSVSELTTHQEAIQTFNNPKGDKIFGTHGYVAGQQWCVLAEMTSAEVLQPISSLGWLFAVVGGCIMLIITFFAFWFSNHYSRPIVHLLNEIKMIVLGKYDHRISFDRKDEIGQISNYINHLAEHTQKDTTKHD
jgi:sensor histidine kinase YesM